MSAPVHPPGFELNRLIDRLAECDAQSGAVAPDDSTVANLKAQLDTLSEELAQPEPVDPFTEESACRRVVEIVAAIGKDPTFVTATVADHTSADDVRDAELPASIGQYRILSRLGVGGMGAVYKALHTKLEKVVALKVLPADRLKDAGAVARFEREMRAVGKLHHPNIVAAHDAGEINGMHYLVMELVEGIDLGTLLKERGRLPVAEACEIVRQAALGLQHAHEHGLVHRDIKPSNVMLAEGQGSRVKSQGMESTSPLTLTSQPLTVKVLDLGLALLDSNQRELAGELTSTGQIMGTLDYMAPEQGADTHAVDIRADIYSLGATLYKLLTGRAPFEGPQFNTPMKKLTALATVEPQPVRALRADVPAELAGIVHRMLAKRADDRPTPPAALAALLQPFAAAADLARLLDQPSHDKRANRTTAETTTDPTVLAQTAVGNDPAQSRSLPALVAPEAATSRPVRGSNVRVRTVLKLAALLVPLALITIQMKQGTVTIDSDERLADDVEIVVTSGDEVLILSKSNGWKVRARAGEYHVEVRGGNDQFKVEKNRLGVSRWGTTIVDIRFDEPQEAVAARVNPTSAAANFALQFDGVDDYVKIPNPPDWQSGPLTIEAFVTMAETGPRLSCVVRAAALKLRLHRTAPQWMFMAYDDPDTELTGDDRLATLGRRVHLAGVWDQATLSLYVDGEFRGRSPIHKGFKLLDPLSDGYIGASPASNAQDPRNHEGLMHGTIDEVRISDFVRYTENFPPAERFERDEHTLALYHFDEGEGDVLHDASGNGHDGKIVGATWVPLQSPSHDRAVADWVVARGGRVLLRMHDGGDIFRGTGEPLPDGPFQVRSIDLNGKQVVDVDLARISGLSGLIGLHLNRTSVTDAGLDHVSRIEPLQVLDLDGTAVGRNGLEPLRRLTFLRRLSLVQTSFNDDCAPVIAELGQLEYLNVSHTQVTDHALAELARCPQLREVGLASCSRITDAGIVSLAAAPNLTSLGLGDTRITDAALETLGRLDRLEALTVEGTSVTDAGIRHLAGLGRLQMLAVHSTRITDAALAIVADMPQLANLRLENTQVSDEGIKLLHNSGLTEVRLQSTRVTADAVTRLHRALPTCRIDSDSGTFEPAISPKTAPNFALQFDGRSTYVDIPSLPYDGSHPLTLEARVTPRKRLAEDQSDYVLGNIRDRMRKGGVVLRQFDAGWRATVFTDSAGPAYPTASDDSLDAVDLALVYDLNETRLYVNGHLAHSVATAPARHLASTEAFFIGGPAGRKDSTYFDGVIDEVRISRVARFTANYSPAARLETDGDTLALYHFDEGEGDVLHDVSGHGHDGKIVGGTWVRADTAAEVRVPDSPAGAPIVWTPTSEQQAFLDAVALLPAEQQESAVREKLKAVNSGYDGTCEHLIADGKIVRLSLKGNTQTVREIWPIAALTGLTELLLGEVPVTDVSPVQRLTELRFLSCYRTAITDISPFSALKKLEVFDCRETLVRDLTPLAGLPLRELQTFAVSTYNEQFRQLAATWPQLKSINGIPIAEFLARRDEVEELKKVLPAFPAERQLALVVERLAKLNPGWNGELSHQIVEGKLTHITLAAPHVVWDISPLAALPNLKGLTCNGNPQLADLSPLAGMQLEQLFCHASSIADLSPLQGMPIKSLICGYTPVVDLAPLAGMPLEYLEADSTRIAHLTPLADLPLQHLSISGTGVGDLAPLEGMPLHYFECGTTRVTSLEALRGMQLTFLGCGQNGIADLSPLAGMPLEELRCSDTQVRDFSPLAGMPLAKLHVSSNDGLSDLSFLAGMPLAELDCRFSAVSDFSPLKGMLLERIRTDSHLLGTHDEEVLRSLPKVTEINSMPTAEYWQQIDQRRREAAEWKDALTAVSGEQQFEMVRQELTELHAAFEYVPSYSLEPAYADGNLVELFIVVHSGDLVDLRPLCGLTHLRKLSLAGHLPHVRDLSPLYALPLEELDVGSDVVVRSNVLGLRTMPTLRTLDGRSAAEYLRLLAEPDRVTAEEALRLGGKVTVRAADETEARTVESIDTLPERVRTLDAVDLSYTQVVDDDLAGLRPAAGLKALSLDSADRIGDAGLAHLAGLPLRSLDLRNTQVSDAGLPELLQLPDLAELSLQHTAVTDAGMAIVRQLPRLRNLTLSNNRVGDAGVAQLRGMTSLHILSIYDTQLTDAGLAHVATLVNLEDLSLSSTAVTDAGLKLLLPLQQLHHLFLERTAISDVGLAHLATLSNLRVLFLRETGIGNTGLTHLETAPVLQELFLERTRVTEEGILQLHSARPLIRIHWDGGVIEPESAEAAP